jgi:hypothetical protein
MEKKQAEQERIKYANLENRILVHKKLNKRMQVVKVGIGETFPKSNLFYLYCELKGELGNVVETIEYVLVNYTTKGR